MRRIVAALSALALASCASTSANLPTATPRTSLYVQVSYTMGVTGCHPEWFSSATLTVFDMQGHLIGYPDDVTESDPSKDECWQRVEFGELLPVTGPIRIRADSATTYHSWDYTIGTGTANKGLVQISGDDFLTV